MMSIVQPTEKLQKELAAQKKRAQALQYLEKQGQSVGPISLQQIEENKKKGDNTLDLLLKERASNLSKNVEKESKQALLNQQNAARLSEKTNANIQSEIVSNTVLAHRWKETVDPVSGKTYYWNTTTNETKWERPVQPIQPASSSVSMNGLPPNWIEKLHASTKQIFYVNTVSGITSFTRPAFDAPSSSGRPSDQVAYGSQSATSEQQSNKRARVEHGGAADPLDPLQGKVKEHYSGKHT